MAVDPDAPPPAPAADPAPTRRSRLPWLLGLALAVSLVLLLAQTQRADRLAGRVESLTGELRSARGLIDAYEGRMEAVRGHVDDLTARLGALSDLVADDPKAAAEAEPTD